MDLKQLRCFVAIVDHGTFNAAAAALNVSQPSLSTRMKVLEQEIDDVLLVRGSKGVTLTPIGKIFYAYAKSILREAEKAIEEVQIVKGLRRGRVTVGLSAVYTSFIAPEAINAFFRRYPDLEVATDVSTHTIAGMVENLHQGQWDFGCGLNVNSDQIPDSIKVEQIGTFGSGIYAAADHPLARKRTCAIDDLAAFDWVTGWNVTGSYLRAFFERHKVTPPRISLVSNSFGMIRETVSSSQFLCLLPHRYVQHDVAAGRLAHLRQDLVQFQNRAMLLYPARTRLTAAARHLVEEFRKAAGQPDRIGGKRPVRDGAAFRSA